VLGVLTLQYPIIGATYSGGKLQVTEVPTNCWICFKKIGSIPIVEELSPALLYTSTLAFEMISEKPHVPFVETPLKRRVDSRVFMKKRLNVELPLQDTVAGSQFWAAFAKQAMFVPQLTEVLSTDTANIFFTGGGVEVGVGVSVTYGGLKLPDDCPGGNVSFVRDWESLPVVDDDTTIADWVAL
jgi:hypothetical protein